jgi:AcrR family transcriptional regulator
MDDIAERADVARATVFNHFPRKAAFIDEWTARRQERAAVALGINDLDLSCCSFCCASCDPGVAYWTWTLATPPPRSRGISRTGERAVNGLPAPRMSLSCHGKHALTRPSSPPTCRSFWAER